MGGMTYSSPLLEQIESNIWRFYKDAGDKFPTQITFHRAFFTDTFWPCDEVQDRIKYSFRSVKLEEERIAIAAALIAPPNTPEFRVLLADPPEQNYAWTLA